MDNKGKELWEYLMDYGWMVLVIMFIGLLLWQLGVFGHLEKEEGMTIEEIKEEMKQRNDCIKEHCPFGPIIANSFIFYEEKGGYNYSEIERWKNEVRMGGYFLIDEDEFIESVKVYENDSEGIYWVFEKKYPRYKSYRFQCEYLRECEMM